MSEVKSTAKEIKDRKLRKTEILPTVLSSRRSSEEKLPDKRLRRKFRLTEEYYQDLYKFIKAKFVKNARGDQMSGYIRVAIGYECWRKRLLGMGPIQNNQSTTISTLWLIG